MEMSGSYRIAAARQQVWDALNDPEILRACIPGCEELTKTGDNGFEAKVRAKVGPVSAKFAGNVTLSDINPPESYTISGEGKGGAAGFAKGGAKVNLEEDGSDTILRYTVEAKVGGKLAQLGSRLIDGTAKKMADDFFGGFAATVAGAPPIKEPEKAEAPPEAAPETPMPAPPAPEAPATAPQAPEAPAAQAAKQAEDAAAKRPAAEQAIAKAAAEALESTKDRRSLSPAVWIALLIAAVVVLLVIFGLPN